MRSLEVFLKTLWVVNCCCYPVRIREIDFFIEHNADGISTASPEFMDNSRFTKGSKYITTKNNHNWADAVKIPSITLDNLIEHYGTPDLIKIDVEGYEYTVLKGLTK